MKTKMWLGLLVAAAFSVQPICAQAPPPGDTAPVAAPEPGKPATPVSVPVNISPAAAEVVRLAESGLGEEVVSAYVTNSTTGFNLSAEDIVYLKDVGVSETIIALMISHDKVLRESGPPPTAPAPAPRTQPEPEPANPPVVTPPATPPPEYVSSPPVEVNYFYNDLAPYGTWLELDGVGWCWQPRCGVINPVWQPYCDYGHWVYTDCGWYWSSSYSWGWAPFHYGRWARHSRCGWVWTPDRVWGPAWVSWRVHGDNCGWAPLPPFAVFDFHTGWHYRGASVGLTFDFGLRPEHYTFVAFRDFGNHNIERHRLSRTEVTRVYNNTTIINNYSGDRNTIVNHGVSVDRVSAESRVRIQRASVREVSADRGVQHGISERQNVVYRHELPTTPKPTPNVVAQRVDSRHPVVHPTPITSTRVESRPGQRFDYNVPRQPLPGANQVPRRGNERVSPQTSTGDLEHRPPNVRGIDQMTRTQPATPPAVPSRNLERSVAPRVTPPTVPAPTGQASSSREYPQVPRAPQTYESAPRSVPTRPQTEYRSAPQYYPKGYQQSSEVRSAPRAEPRQPSPSGSGGSSSHGDGRGQGQNR